MLLFVITFFGVCSFLRSSFLLSFVRFLTAPFVESNIIQTCPEISYAIFLDLLLFSASPVIMIAAIEPLLLTTERFFCHAILFA
ncbi:hypothetical protein F5J12DRAFT_456077 [Pisolithus orientalis]|uniref:uncharacterized protein n=1 Tax=Pisolithus orientalis TaxID=936130 RepID=UPI00222544DA|nr:uncharacterized protein F5J12DRAFT_456077 [Pisolithus orientalis]KAI6025962.1 hypothetical protein F5J12DRAFT_456077 [Pisolithus orientalis]